MKADIIDRMKANSEIGRIAMMAVRADKHLSHKTARLVAVTVENPEAGKAEIESDGSDEALAAVWILDDADRISGSFKEVQKRIRKLHYQLGKAGYSMHQDEEKGFVVTKRGAKGRYTIVPVFKKKGDLVEVSFGCDCLARASEFRTQAQLEEERVQLDEVIRLLKKLNNPPLKVERLALRLAVYDLEHQLKLKKDREKKAKERKERKSL